MYKQNHDCIISYKEEMAPDIIDMRVINKEIAEQAKPGQFLNIKCGNALNTILRRPISICDIDKEKNEVRFVFQIKGEGTKILAMKNVNQSIDILGPLGTPFAISKNYKKPLIIGGGIGTFPLLYLAKSLQCDNIITYIGFRNKDMVVLEDDFKEVCAKLDIATDDGSYMYKGYVTELMENKIQKGNIDIVYGCGPTPMLKIIQQICDKYNVPCQLSLEQRMGCGIGACLVCACKIKTTDGEQYKRVCKDGPVFWGNEVVFDE